MEKVISFDKPNDTTILNKILGTLDKNKSAITFGTVVPADLNLGQFYVMDNGIGTKRLYFKTAEGNVVGLDIPSSLGISGYSGQSGYSGSNASMSGVSGY